MCTILMILLCRYFILRHLSHFLLLLTLLLYFLLPRTCAAPVLYFFLIYPHHFLISTFSLLPDVLVSVALQLLQDSVYYVEVHYKYFLWVTLTLIIFTVCWFLELPGHSFPSLRFVRSCNCGVVSHKSFHFLFLLLAHIILSFPASLRSLF